MGNRIDLQTSLAVARQHILVGRFDDARVELLDVIRAIPGSIEAYRLLIEVEQTLGNTGHAQLALERLSALEPDNAGTWCTLGDVYYLLTDWDSARDAYKRALHLQPRDRQYLARLAYSQLSGQMFTELETTRTLLLENHADFGGTHFIEGHIHKSQGDLALATKSYERAVEIDPDFCEAIFNLVELSTPAPDDKFTVRIRSLLDNGQLAAIECAHLHFALARIYENAEQLDNAFGHYDKANQSLQRAMKERGLIYDPQREEARISQIISAYPEDAFRKPIDPLAISTTPIFIVGMPRSGTSLIEQILGSHPSVSAGGEMTIAQTCMRQYTMRRKTLQLGVPANWNEEAESNLLMEIREQYIEYLFDHNLDRDYVTDKLPGNFEILGFIKRMFPNAIIVHCRRDPLATCWSLYAANFGEHDPYYTSLKHLAHYYGQYRRLMKHWSMVLRPAMIEVEYEELVSSPKQSIRRLLDQCGLPWDDRCEHFNSNPRPVMTASFGQVRQSIYTSSISKWQKYEHHLGDLKALIDDTV